MTEARQKAEESRTLREIWKRFEGQTFSFGKTELALCKAYEDAIRSREQELEKLRWIPCSERLPEEQGEYEVFVDGSMDNKRGVYTPFYFFPIHKRFREDVTHWRALPGAPKERQ